MKVYELREDDYDGSGHGLFATRELAEAEIVRLALAGGVKKVTIDELEISGEPAQRGALDGDAVAALRVSGGPWYAGAHNIELGDGTSLEVSTAEGTPGDDARIALTVVQLVNTAMAGKWNA